MSVNRNEPIPFFDRIADPKGFVTQLWTQWLENVLVPLVQSAPSQVGQYANETPLNAALATTILATVQGAGLYLFAAALQVVTAAGVSSNVQLTLTWTSNGVTQTENFTAIVNGTTASHGGYSFPIIVDANTPVTIATTYASNPASAMTYNLRASLSLAGEN